jgi:hypothetical protein
VPRILQDAKGDVSAPVVISEVQLEQGTAEDLYSAIRVGVETNSEATWTTLYDIHIFFSDVYVLMPDCPLTGSDRWINTRVVEVYTFMFNDFLSKQNRREHVLSGCFSVELSTTSDIGAWSTR